MATTKAKRHVHKYYLADLPGFAKVWACALPDCNHYMPPHMERLVNGKHSICWGCGDVLTLNPQNMDTGKPLCNDCENEKLLGHSVSQH
jgi:hypothetical protein